MKRLYLLLVAGLLVLGALMIACNDKKDDDGDNGGPTATTSAGETPSEGETPDDGGNGDGDGDAQAELQGLAGEFANREAKVTYDFTSSAAGTESTGSFTLFWKPPDSWRMDMTMADSPPITMISSGGTSYTCSGDDAGGGSCFASTAGAIPIPFLSYFTDPSQLNSLVDSTFAGVDVDRFDETIAGQDGSCFRASGSVEGESGSGEWCFTDDGLMLRVRATAEGSGTFTLEATSIGEGVTDADFEPPYEIMTIPGQ
jgi:hypothetical protein